MTTGNWQDRLPPANSFKLKDHYSIQEFIDIMAFLRSDQGCPWDKVQTHTSLRKNLIEEAYEAIDAIDSGDPDRLCDELGDVLMQVVLHAQLAMEDGKFNFDDVVTTISRKMISRHTHIFGDDHAETPDQVINTWEKNKLKEKGFQNQSQVLADVPLSLPALQRSYKVQQKASQVGFDWDDASGPRDKISEELMEIELELHTTHQAVQDGLLTPENADLQVAAEMGDLLFAVVNYARHLKVQPEMALNKTTDKFIRRFARVEEMASLHGQTLEDMDLAAMDLLWEQVKLEEKRGVQA
ncbi:MAG TPA: nucleoside triphosphate pyrophosphohydrolase [Clostridiales bacterium]|nr:nucleoside triphosphate pyrophosphohydrolase [Clostridiales bacterium]